MGSIGANANTPFVYQRSADLKEWSAAEEKRTQETSRMVDGYWNAGGEWGTFYDTDGEQVYSAEVGEEYGMREGTELLITKEHFVYALNYDENDRRVKKGKKVTGSTFYTVSIDGQTLDENVAGYKTLADAKHALNLELDWLKQREQHYRRQRR